MWYCNSSGKMYTMHTFLGKNVIYKLCWQYLYIITTRMLPCSFLRDIDYLNMTTLEKYIKRHPYVETIIKKWSCLLPRIIVSQKDHMISMKQMSSFLVHSRINVKQNYMMPQTQYICKSNNDITIKAPKWKLTIHSTKERKCMNRTRYSIQPPL